MCLCVIYLLHKYHIIYIEIRDHIFKDIITKHHKLLYTSHRPARCARLFLWWSHYYYYFVIWTNLMKSNAFYNHIYHKIIFYYYKIVLFKIWNLNSTIANWLIFTSLSQLNTFSMLHVNILVHVGNFFSMEVKKIKIHLVLMFSKN